MPKLIIMGIIGAATGGAITSAVYWIQQEWDNAAKQKENQRLAEEKIRLSPRLGVRILPSSMEVPGYEYPLERYSLYIENGNTESVPVLDLRIEFNFNNVVVRTTSQIMPGSGEDIADLEIITRSKDGTISSYAEMPR